MQASRQQLGETLEVSSRAGAFEAAQRFNGVWARLGRIAQAAELPTRARERLAKAQRLTTQLLATFTFFFATLPLQIEALALHPSWSAPSSNN
ncbi:hypothetical protein ACCUM_0211 [Candidatus Accumulibacter phosphatis]|uniref:Uncharacterized protein n=1 Tax=Candidatus Accumulibacter phosphatis TaxID=327160 RepID=A0A5S4EKY9_9PROT|nr:hypothetical protein ACCUM_0211 [Candidatus Accumulibacter phosphatis]